MCTTRSEAYTRKLRRIAQRLVSSFSWSTRQNTKEQDNNYFFACSPRLNLYIMQHHSNENTSLNNTIFHQKTFYAKNQRIWKKIRSKKAHIAWKRSNSSFHLRSTSQTIDRNHKHTQPYIISLEYIL